MAECQHYTAKQLLSMPVSEASEILLLLHIEELRFLLNEMHDLDQEKYADIVGVLKALILLDNARVKCKLLHTEEVRLLNETHDLDQEKHADIVDLLKAFILVRYAEVKWKGYH